MKNKKVHLNGEYFNSKACNKLINYTSAIRFKEFYNLPKEQQCQSCLKTKYYQEQVQKMESERKASSEELGIKTQLEKDTEKYNFNAEQVDVLSKIDYEVHTTGLMTNKCHKCLLFETDCSSIKCEISDGNEENIFFKQTSKIPEETPEETNKQESEHYQNGLDTIKKIKETLDNLEGEITLFQAYCLGNLIKYEDRAGLKDDASKDLYKASDYTTMMINNNWIGRD